MKQVASRLITLCYHVMPGASLPQCNPLAKGLLTIQAIKECVVPYGWCYCELSVHGSSHPSITQYIVHSVRTLDIRMALTWHSSLGVVYIESTHGKDQAGFVCVSIITSICQQIAPEGCMNPGPNESGGQTA